MDHFELRAAMQQHRADMHARHNRIALLERQLREATADRDRSVERFVSFGEAHEAARHDTALRSIGRELGVTHRAVTGMVDRARTRAPHPTADAPLIPVLTAEQARAYVESGALGNLSRVHVAFNPNDIVLESGLDPSAFPDLGDRDAPNMLLFGDDGAVVGVEECLAGYGGTGPSNTVRLLRELGFPEQLREEVFHSRYLELTPTDVLRASPESVHRAGGGLGLSADGQHLVVRVPGGSATVADWTAEVLAEPAKYPWAAGTRRARVYLDRDASAPLQEPYRAWRGTSSYSVIIEQGRLQLWVAAVYPFRFSDLLSTEQLQILDSADMRPADIEPRTWLDRLIPNRRDRPLFITISEDGQDLTHTPEGTPA